MSYGRALAALACVAAVLLLASIRYTRLGCDAVGGRWASVPGVCTTPLCGHFGGCGTWASPLLPVNSIHVGTRAVEVRFILGEPTRDDDTAFYWEEFKDGTQVRAVFDDGRVTAMSCVGPSCTDVGAQ